MAKIVPEPSHFLTLSNARTGSTWLQTSLNLLPGVLTQKEFKWRPHGYAAQPIHLVLHDESDDVVTQLNAMAQEARADEEIQAIGSKLVLDPHVYLGAESIRRLKTKLPPSVRLLAVTRSYLDIFLSFYARGVLHARTGRSAERGKEDAALASAVAGYDASAWAPRQVWLTELERLAFPPQGAAGPEPNARSMSIADACDAIFVLYYNDALICDLLRPTGSEAAIVEYADVGRRFSGIVRALGLTAPAGIANAAIEDPYLVKLPVLDGSLVAPSGILARLCETLDASRLRFARERRLPVSAAPTGGAISIEDHGVAAFLASHFDPARNKDLFKIDGGAVTWRCRSPIV